MPVLQNVKTTSLSYSLLTLFLRASLVVALFLSGWLIYSKLPHQASRNPPANNAETNVQIVLRPPAGNSAEPLDIAVEFYPFDIVSVHHEYFTEPRAGKRFNDFLKERMQGRNPVTARLDKHGQAFVGVTPGNWWLHAQLPGEENLEWRLRVDISGPRQIVELTPQNVYTRTRSF